VTTQPSNRLELKDRGDWLFKQLGRDVMELKTIERQDPHEIRLHCILKGLRVETESDRLSDEDIKFLHSFLLHPDNKIFTKIEMENIQESSRWLFANKAPRDHRNLKTI
jgi:hypothetical protein